MSACLCPGGLLDAAYAESTKPQEKKKKKGFFSKAFEGIKQSVKEAKDDLKNNKGEHKQQFKEDMKSSAKGLKEEAKILSTNEEFKQYKGMSVYSYYENGKEYRLDKGEVLTRKHGYAKEYENVRKLILARKLDEVDPFYQRNWQERNNRIRLLRSKQPGFKSNRKVYVTPLKKDFLRLMERSTVALFGGDTVSAVDSLAVSEAFYLDEERNKSKLSTFFRKKFTNFAEVLGGSEEWRDYPAQGYEKVLVLNMKSIAYLLDGNRNAYPVTRRAIDLQNSEREAFFKSLKQIEAEVKKQESEISKKLKNNVKAYRGLVSAMNKTYRKTDVKAKSVPSAYVNPFGFYVAGMVQEFDSYRDRSLFDNARISYEKALELNPKSGVIKNAVQQMKKRTHPENRKLVHVIVEKGFSPGKIMGIYGYQVGKNVLPVRFPLFVPVKDAISKITVQNSKGTVLANLGIIADVEALALRHQKDMEPFYQHRVNVSLIRSKVFTSFAKGVGNMGMAMMDNYYKNSTPDLRAWMSLPKMVMGARLHLSKRTSLIYIVAQSSSGKVLAKKKVKLKVDQPNFVYGRAINNVLYAHSSSDHWIKL